MHKALQKDAANVGKRLGQNETFSWEKGTEFSDTLLKKRRQSESSRPLSDLSTDLLVMSRNQLGKRGYIKIPTMLKDRADARTFRMADISLPVSILTTTANRIREWKRLKRINLPRERWKWCHQEPCMPFHPFHRKLQSRMTNFNFLAQPTIITVLHSLRYLRQSRSQNSIWRQSLSSLDGIVVRVNVNFERKGVVWIESWLWMICEEDVCWVGIPRTCSLWACSCLGKPKWCIIVSLFHVVIMTKY